jgi:hypothetical protein
LTAVNASARTAELQREGSPFDLDDEASYRRWRDAKLAASPTCADELRVDIADPAALSAAEREALLDRLARANLALYHCGASAVGTAEVVALGAQLGLTQLDANWLADEDGISRIEVSSDEAGRADFIPYTNRPIRWHTDGYYHPAERRIRSMILHCVRPAREGGVNALLDHEIAYIALRDRSPDHIRALMASDAMTIPAREDAAGVARPAQSGPVFSVDAQDGTLHMRYTARTRSIEWRCDAATRAAVAALEELLASDLPWILRVRQDAGMGLVAHNLLHDRSGFSDDPVRPRLLLRARFLDRTAAQRWPWHTT